jgi:hypothetical protein
MKHSSPKRPLLLGLALTITGAGGAAIAVTLAVTGPSPAHNPPMVSAAAQASLPATPPPIAPAAATSVAPVPPTHAPTPVSLDQVRAIAQRAGHGQVDKIEADAGPAGITYDVSVIRSDGTDAQLIVDARTGRILSNLAEQQDPQEQSDTPDPQDSSN